MLRASSREKPRRSATTQAHAIMTGARFTTANLRLSASSSRSSWKSRLPSMVPSSEGGPGMYSSFFILGRTARSDDVRGSRLRLFDGDDDDAFGRPVSLTVYIRHI